MRRRRFMVLMAASAAAVLTKPMESALAAPARKPAPATTGMPMSAAMRKEIASQKQSVADTLRAIRAYDLPSALVEVMRNGRRTTPACFNRQAMSSSSRPQPS